MAMLLNALKRCNDFLCLDCESCNTTKADAETTKQVKKLEKQNLESQVNNLQDSLKARDDTIEKLICEIVTLKEKSGLRQLEMEKQMSESIRKLEQDQQVEKDAMQKVYMQQLEEIGDLKQRLISVEVTKGLQSKLLEDNSHLTKQISALLENLQIQQERNKDLASELKETSLMKVQIETLKNENEKLKLSEYSLSRALEEQITLRETTEKLNKDLKEQLTKMEQDFTTLKLQEHTSVQYQKDACANQQAKEKPQLLKDVGSISDFLRNQVKKNNDLKSELNDNSKMLNEEDNSLKMSKGTQGFNFKATANIQHLQDTIKPDNSDFKKHCRETGVIIEDDSHLSSQREIQPVSESNHQHFEDEEPSCSYSQNQTQREFFYTMTPEDYYDFLVQGFLSELD
nr:M protein, serotype 12-like [Nothobranchius furzeri]